MVVMTPRLELRSFSAEAVPTVLEVELKEVYGRRHQTS
ncbi:hypothetical protein A2U01_0089152, partial [Trifolium medium]|nr:hypothetical protein [Trifolium medium]